MIDNHFRQLLPPYVRFLLRIFSSLKLTPNQITWIGFFLSLSSAVLVCRHLFFVAAVVWWLSRLLDACDGIFARNSGQTTTFGAFLDILLDMAAYSTMIIAFSIVFPEYSTNWIVILFLYVLCITGALALGNLEDRHNIPGQNNRGLRLAAGIAEGGETGIAYTLFLLFPSHVDILSKIWIGILLLTVLARLLLAKRLLTNFEKGV